MSTIGLQEVNTIRIFEPHPKRLTALAMFLAAVLAPPVVSANDAAWRYTSGVDISTGDYGSSADTDIVYVPFSVSRKTGDWTLKATVPWISLDGPGGVVGGGDAVIVVPGAQSFNESGLGDIWLTGTYAVAGFPAGWGFLDLSGKVKLPTANEDKGLGTGEIDYTVQADLFKPIGRWMPMASLAYKVKGEPAGVALDDVWYLSMGTGYRISDTSSVGATVDVQQASATGADDPREIMGYWSQRVSSHWNFTLYGYLGLSDGSPDQGFGVQMSYGQR